MTSRNNLSALGTRSASSTVAARNSTFAKSSIAILSLEGADGPPAAIGDGAGFRPSCALLASTDAPLLDVALLHSISAIIFPLSIFGKAGVIWPIADTPTGAPQPVSFGFI